jgi:hypothetical protein
LKKIDRALLEESTSLAEQSPESFVERPNLTIVTAEMHDKVQHISGPAADRTGDVVVCIKYKEQGDEVVSVETEDACSVEVTCFVCRSKVMLRKVKGEKQVRLSSVNKK